MTRSDDSAQARAQRHYRDRLQAEGLARFEIVGRECDKAILRTLAKRLAKPGAEADRLRVDLVRLAGDDARSGRFIVDALRASPLVGADITFERHRSPGRKIEL